MPIRARLPGALVLALALAATAACEGDCNSPTGGCRGGYALDGSWSGTSTYINAPFTMELRQNGLIVTGQYRDQKDAGMVSGSVLGSTFVLDVNFGDTGLRLNGTFESRERLTGEIIVPVLGARRFPFEMTR